MLGSILPDPRQATVEENLPLIPLWSQKRLISSNFENWLEKKKLAKPSTTFTWAVLFCAIYTVHAHEHTYTFTELSLDLNCMFVTVDVIDKAIFIRLPVLIQHELLDDPVGLCSGTEASIRFTIHPHAVIHECVRMCRACRVSSTNKHLNSHVYAFTSEISIHRRHRVYLLVHA